jgi:lysophospholipase L1-like esterase
MRKLLQNLAMLFFSLLFTLALLEGAARIFKLGTGLFWQPDSQLGWVNIPDAKGWESCYGECQIRVTINSKGLRDREIPYEKESGTNRILMLGDSTTAAMQVTLEDTFVKQLENDLNKDSGNWEVINAGVNAYGTDNEFLFYRLEGEKYDPDIVFLNMYLANDVYNNQPTLELRFGGQSAKPYFTLNDDGELELQNFPVEDTATFGTKVGTFLKKHFQLPRFVAQTLALRGEIPSWLAPIVRLFGGGRGATSAGSDAAQTEGETGSQAVEDGGGEDEGTAVQTPPRRPDICDPEPLPIIENAWNVTEALILELEKEVEANGAQLAVLIIPAAPQIVPPAAGEAWYCDVPNDQLAAFLDEAGIPYLDMLPAFREEALAGGGPYYFERDFHMNALGHDLTSDLLYKFVDENLVTTDN